MENQMEKTVKIENGFVQGWAEYQVYAKASKQAGFSLLGFGLASLLALGVVIGLVQAYEDNAGRVAESDARSNLSSIRAGIVQKIGPTGNFGVLDDEGSQLLIDLDVIPGTLVQGSKVRNEFNGFYTFGSSNGGVTSAPDDAYATISTDELPLSMCIDLASSGEGWQQVEVNSTVVDGTMGAAQTNCSDSGNTLTFTFRR